MKSRLLIVLLVLVGWNGAIAKRLYTLQVVEHEKWRARAERQQLTDLNLQPPRGSIFDARGRQLAVSLQVDSAFAVGNEIEDKAAFAAALGEIEGIDTTDLAAKLERSPKYAWVARQLDEQAARSMRQLGLEGLHFEEESKRYYPQGRLAAPVLGFVGVDHRGLEGLERRYDQAASRESVRRKVLRDALSETLAPPQHPFQEVAPGSDLHLTIDASIQFLVERELARGVETHNASSGMAIVLDPSSGAVLAMASYPDFDPNHFGEFAGEERRNRVVMDAFEPGSTFKLVTAAAALEANVVDPNDEIDCEQGGITLSGTRINDHKPFGVLTFREVIAKSSNVGAIKAGLMAGERALYEKVLAFGFGAKTGIDLPGESAGIVRPLDRWARLEAAYTAFGQGLSVTALQMAAAYGAIANGGVLVRPYVVAGVGAGDRVEQLGERPASRGQAVDAATAFTLERLLENVIAEGTGALAAVPGYRVAGKTGTAQKAIPGGYSPNRFLASFVGFAPARGPALVCLVVIDEPRPLFHGGEVAAPVFAAIMRQVLPYLKIAPDAEPRDSWPAAQVLEPSVSVAENGESQPGDAAPGALSRVAAAGTLPDFSGLSASQAVYESARLDLTPKLWGSGFVVKQAPAAGTTMEIAEGALEFWLASSPLS